MQITQYFGPKSEPSGFYCVDLDDTPQPYFVESRMEILQDCSVNPFEGMRIQIEDEGSDSPWEASEEIPRTEFVHDRWPLFSTETSAFNLSIQYLVSTKTVYQIYTFTLNETSESPLQLPKLAISTDLLIRDLNFLQYSYHDKHFSDKDIYVNCVPDGGHCLIRMHKTLHTEANRPDVVALFISPFIDDRPQNIQFIEEIHSYGLILDDEAIYGLKNNNRLEITLAYTLKLIPSSDVERSSSPTSSKELLTAKERLVKDPFKIMTFIEDGHLNFTIRRNLEHILSVCSIPIEATDSGFAPVALTCGDVSGHRVATAASL